MDDPARDCGIFSTVVRGAKVPLRRAQGRRRCYSITAAGDASTLLSTGSSVSEF